MKKNRVISLLLIIFLTLGNINGALADSVYGKGEEADSSNEITEDIEEDQEVKDEIEKDENIEEKEIEDKEKIDSKDKRDDKALDEYNYGTIIVNNVNEFNTIIKNQTGDLIVVLGDEFPTSLRESLVIEKNNNFNLVVDGKGKRLISDGIDMVAIRIATIKGNLSIKDLKLDGKDHNGKLGLDVSNGPGKIYLENMTVDNYKSGLLLGQVDIKLDNVEFKNNVDPVTGGAIFVFWDYTYNTIEIVNSSFIGNIAGGHGAYGGGAVSTKHFTGNLIIKNSFFENNSTTASPTGITIGGGGGAIFMSMFKGSMDIDNCYFKGNTTNMSNDGKEGTYDGGAIYLHDVIENSSVNISNTTFTENIAKDDGGAVLIQVMGPNTTIDNINFDNNTFYKNEGHGLGEGIATGGAIQIYANIGGLNSLTVRPTFKNNTFYKNSVGVKGNTKSLSGGGISATGGIFVTKELLLDNNIFIGNEIIKEDGSVSTSETRNKNISGATIAIPLRETNLGIDNGREIEKTIILEDGSEAKVKYGDKDIFGKYNVLPIDNHGKITAGAENSKKIIPTIPIKPQILDRNTEISADSLRDEKVLGLDQRGYKRHKDVGAVEMSYIKYHAHKIEEEQKYFTLPELSNYDGTEYYEGSSPKEYFDIAYISDSLVIKDGMDLGLDDNIFLGWTTDPNSDEVDPSYAVGRTVELGEEDINLYAVYLFKHKVLYDGNGNTGGLAPVDSNSPYEDETEVTVLGSGSLEKTDYRFKGWNTSQDGTGITYAVGDEFTIEKDTTLYAVWEEIPKYKLVYDGNGHTNGQVTVDKNSPYEEGSLVTVLGSGNMTRDKYIFKGWYASVDGKTVQYPVGSQFVIEKDMTLYAIWDREGTGGGEIINPPIINPPIEPEEPEVPEKPEKPEKPENGKINKGEHFAYIDGYLDKTIKPEDKLKREEAAAMLFRILDSDYRETIRTNSHNYSDVKKDRWSSKYIGTLTKGDIIEGYGDGTFRPTNTITRAEIATMISRFMTDVPEGTSKFKDVKGHWAEKYIAYANSQGWVIGYEDGTFRPNASITRAEFITMVNNLLERGAQEKNMLPGRKEFKDVNRNAWYYEDIEEAANSHTHKIENGIENWLELKNFDIEM